ncbi:unnamed protein product, partial [Brassica napus]
MMKVLSNHDASRLLVFTTRHLKCLHVKGFNVDVLLHFLKETMVTTCLSMLPLFKLHENDGGFLVKGQVMIVAELDVFEVIGTFDDVVAAESSDLLKKTSLGINANGTKPVENSVKPPQRKLRTESLIIV